jgi:hypothetical protein
VLCKKWLVCYKKVADLSRNLTESAEIWHKWQKMTKKQYMVRIILIKTNYGKSDQAGSYIYRAEGSHRKLTIWVELESSSWILSIPLAWWSAGGRGAGAHCEISNADGCLLVPWICNRPRIVLGHKAYMCALDEEALELRKSLRQSL